MALPVETVSVQTASKRSEGEDKYKREDALRAFGKRTLALCKELHQYGPLDEVEFQFMDTHFQVLEMAYLRWKRKQKALGIH